MARKIKKAIPKSPEPQHEAFTQWAKERGVEVDKLYPAQFAGRGLGMVARRRIKAGEELVNVPATVLLTERSVPKKFRDRLGGIRVHGLLAAFLAFGEPDVDVYAPWRATWPSFAEFQKSVPILWPAKLQALLNDASSALLAQQKAKFDSDWSIAQSAFPDADRDTYLHLWLVVNTRCFYYELPGLKRKRAKEDRMVMCPFSDYFNHADQGCRVSFDKDGYTITADKAYDPGDEVYFPYGNHSNDLLLVEYGFVPKENRWDYLCLDEVILNMLSLEHKRMLELEGYLGKYTLTSSEGLCYRTQVAIRLLTLDIPDWNRYIRGRSPSAAQDFQAQEVIEKHILQVLDEKIEGASKAFSKMKNEEAMRSQRAIIIKRWTQIKRMVEQARRSNIEK